MRRLKKSIGAIFGDRYIFFVVKMASAAEHRWRDAAYALSMQLLASEETVRLLKLEINEHTQQAVEAASRLTVSEKKMKDGYLTE